MEQKRGEGNKDFKKGGGKLGQGVGALQGGRDWNPLTGYDQFINSKMPDKKKTMLNDELGLCTWDIVAVAILMKMVSKSNSITIFLSLTT